MPEFETEVNERLIRLPPVTDDDSDEFVDRLLRTAEELPEFNFVMPMRHVGSVARDFETDGPTALAVPLVETILDAEPPRPPELELHAQLVALSGLPTVSESVALQIAFGRRVGEKIARTDAIPRDQTYRLFRGESSLIPDTERMQRGIAFLRMTAALIPEWGRTPLFGAIAWLHWARGQRAIAMSYLADAKRIEPGNVLVDGLAGMMASAMPEWLEV